MKIKTIGWLSILLCLCLCLCLCILPMDAYASSTEQASDYINTEQSCSLELTYAYDEVAFSDISINLYQIATVSRDFQYTATEAFAPCKLNLNGNSSQSEWNTVRSTLSNFIAADAPTPISEQKTDEVGKAVFDNLTPGLYFASAVQVTSDGVLYYFAPVLSALPNLNEENAWEYEVSAKCKPDVDNPTGEDIEYKVVKLWNDEGSEGNRTSSVEIDILKDGETVKTVVLSDANDWSYSWNAEDDGSIWSVIERNIPEGYTMTVENRLTTFTVVNSYSAPQTSPDVPITGDTFNVGFYVILMCVSGCALILLTVAQKRRRYE